jgi:hypothetical protein
VNDEARDFLTVVLPNLRDWLQSTTILERLVEFVQSKKRKWWKELSSAKANGCNPIRRTSRALDDLFLPGSSRTFQQSLVCRLLLGGCLKLSQRRHRGRRGVFTVAVFRPPFRLAGVVSLSHGFSWWIVCLAVLGTPALFPARKCALTAIRRSISRSASILQGISANRCLHAPGAPGNG